MMVRPARSTVTTDDARTSMFPMSSTIFPSVANADHTLNPLQTKESWRTQFETMESSTPTKGDSMTTWTFSDGGRAEAGYRGEAGDCATRAIAIATGISYQDVYDALTDVAKELAGTTRGRNKVRGKTPRDGTDKRVIRETMTRLGWEWTPTMSIGSGTTVHLRADELPPGRLVVSVSKHLCAVIDGVVHDTHDPSRDGTRAVYGYWSRGKIT